MTAVLDVKDLRIEFPTRRGPLVAVDGVSFSIAPGEVLGVVGESGAGKSLTGAAIIGLMEPPGRIAAGEIRLGGERIDNLGYEAMRRIRGRRIGAIFQDPLTSLNPLYTIGAQLVETIRTHLAVDAAGAWRAEPDPRPGRFAIGSGDSFFAGLLVTLAAGGALRDALHAASAAGSANSRTPGAGVFVRAEFDAAYARIEVGSP